MHKQQISKHYGLFAFLLFVFSFSPVFCQFYHSRPPTSMTYSGVIRNVQVVSITKEGNVIGIAGGGVVGGIAGNALGRGNILPTAAGAVLGAITGSMIEKNVTRRTALEYIVELSNGQLTTIIQNSQTNFGVGQPVYVIFPSASAPYIVPY
jgi:outer membrane lipoprotein SlyB